MKVILLVNEAELEKRIRQLEERCKKTDVPLDSIFQITAITMPNKPFVDVLLSLSDLKIFDMEEAERNQNFFIKLKSREKKKREIKVPTIC